MKNGFLLLTAFLFLPSAAMAQYGLDSLLMYSLSNDSFDLEGYNVANSSDTKLVIGETEVEPGESARLLFLSYWQTLNSSWSIFQDFEVSLRDNLSFITGIKYEYKNLQKAYDINTAPGIFPDLVDASDPIRYPLLRLQRTNTRTGSSGRIERFTFRESTLSMNRISSIWV